MSTYEDESHQAISSYFIGPQAENLPFFEENIHTILNELKAARANYFPEDGKFITEEIQSSKKFKQLTGKFSNAVRKAANLLGKHSIPFWSPRYEAHMCSDVSMPALLGYFMTMLYNPNNVALEASPITTIAEIEVGEQLCRLFGYNMDSSRKDVPTGWGHITSGGSIANLESVWVARNLKFYPLALRRAMENDGDLDFIADKFKVRTCKGELKLLSKLSVWELLNLKPKVILDIPEALHDQFGISASFLEKALKHFNIQSTGKDSLETYFKIQKTAQTLVSNTRHYSWPKGGAIAGIGSDNIIGIPVDNGARIDMEELEKHLEKCLANEQAVYAVVAVIGSTEEGAVDPLSKILALRQRFQARGLSFLVHADAAWGGYFASMVPRDVMDLPDEPALGEPTGDLDINAEGFVPDLSLKVQTQEDLFALRFADSITVDPHKAGYIPYPAGSLVYRDGRMRYLVTWTTPYIFHEAVTSIGVYGAEGSKPGAAAMSTWLANKCIGLDQDGYGALLSEVSFTCTKFSAHWAAMTTDDDSFVCVPFHMLPSETKPGSTPEDIKVEKQRIRDEILTKCNAEIVEHDKGLPVEEKTMTLLRGLGSDLNINAFALNWRYSDGTLNDDIEEANYLMRRVIERLSVDSPEDDPTKIPLYLTSTEFSPELYGSCAEKFKSRLGIKSSAHDLFVLRNVVMSPFPTEKNFIGNLVAEFRKVVEEEVQVCRERNELGPAYHSFIMQGKDTVYLVYRPSFFVAKHRHQIILKAELAEKDMDIYKQIKDASPGGESILLKTTKKINLLEKLEDLKNGKHTTFDGTMFTETGGPILSAITVQITEVLINRPLASVNRDLDYPSKSMPFYIYGTDGEYHISHMLLRSPNIALSADNVKLDISWTTPGKIVDLTSGSIVKVTDVYEASRQPFPDRNANLPANFFFSPYKKFSVEVYLDNKGREQGGPNLLEGLGEPLARGTMELSDSVHVDSELVNKDIFKRVDKVVKWREEFSKIGEELK